MTPRRKLGVLAVSVVASWAIVIGAGCLLVKAVHAQGMEDSPTCWSWNGGNHSSGSFIKCTPEMKAAAKAVAATIPAPLAAQPQPQMVMVPLKPMPPVVPKRKPKPRLICRPA